MRKEQIWGRWSQHFCASCLWSFYQIPKWAFLGGIQICTELRAGDTLRVFSCVINAKYHRTNLHCSRTLGISLFFHSTNNVFTIMWYSVLNSSRANLILVFDGQVTQFFNGCLICLVLSVMCLLKERWMNWRYWHVEEEKHKIDQFQCTDFLWLLLQEWIALLLTSSETT